MSLRIENKKKYIYNEQANDESSAYHPYTNKSIHPIQKKKYAILTKYILFNKTYVHTYLRVCACVCTQCNVVLRNERKIIIPTTTITTTRNPVKIVINIEWKNVKRQTCLNWKVLKSNQEHRSVAADQEVASSAVKWTTDKKWQK